MDLLRDNMVLIVTVVVLIGIWFALRTTATQFASDSSLDSMLGRGEPVVLEFFGNT
ncbi:MAG: hypothetical protein OEM62_00440 [Acidobacteriota bacterium]|nr:hypothetical protein [Acidobacteriota bacterium]